MELGNVFFQLALAYPVVPQIQFLQIRQGFVQENAQTVFGQFVPSEDQGLDRFVPNEVYQQRHLFVSETHVNEFQDANLVKVEHVEVPRQVDARNLEVDKLHGGILQVGIVVGLLQVRRHYSSQRFRMVLGLQKTSNFSLEIIFVQLLLTSDLTLVGELRSMRSSHFALHASRMIELVAQNLTAELFYLRPVFDLRVLLHELLNSMIVVIVVVAIQKSSSIQTSPIVLELSNFLQTQKLVVVLLFDGCVEDETLVGLSLGVAVSVYQQ